MVVLAILLTAAVVALIVAPLVSQSPEIPYGVSFARGPITPEVLDGMLDSRFCPVCASPLAGYPSEACRVCGTRWD